MAQYSDDQFVSSNPFSVSSRTGEDSDSCGVELGASNGDDFREDAFVSSTPLSSPLNAALPSSLNSLEEDEFAGNLPLSSEITIRPADLADIPGIIELAAEMAVHSMSPFRRPGKEKVIEDRREDLQTLYQHWWDPDMGIFVAVDSLNRVLGHVVVKVGCKEFLTGEEQAWIFDIAVNSHFWGSGLAKRLMEAAENFSEEHGMGYLGLTVTCANLRAIRFYENMGYQDERVQMVKILSPVMPEEI